MRRAALCGAVAALLVAPTAALAEDTGGTAPTTTTTAPSSPTAPSAPTDAPDPALRPTATLAGAGTWRATPTTTAGRPVRIAGTFSRSLRNRSIVVERLATNGRWSRATSGKVTTTGRFRATWRTSSSQYHELRLRLSGSSSRAAASAGDTASTVQILVQGRSRASFYGPGLYGEKTACGQTLAPDTIGVANRTLPCGTMVEVGIGAKKTVVPVIDRGPFANGADFDLTKATADRIGLDGVATITWIRRVDLDPAR